MSAAFRPTVAVVGAGMAALAAAWELVPRNAAAGDGPRPEVILLEVGRGASLDIRPVGDRGRAGDPASGS